MQDTGSSRVFANSWPMTSLLHLALLLSAAAVTCASSASSTSAHDTSPARRLTQSQKSPTPGSSAFNPRKIVLDVTIGTKAPDCVSRQVILINGNFQPTITFTQGEFVEILVKNNIPKNWPTTAKGISIHWHGFAMKNFQWYDGTKGVSQCPIAPGTSFTYRFKIDEMPGTYFYHDHATMNRADGLQGAAVVNAPAGKATLLPNGGQVLFLSDWWHFTGNAMALRLNRPFAPSKATDASGSWCWVGLPKSILINGIGNYYDCEDVYKREINKRMPSGKIANATDLLAPNVCVAGQLGNTAAPSTCNTDPKAGGPDHARCTQRAEVLVTRGETRVMRIINAATLVYLTVCFEKHSVTVVALDAAPVEPKTFYECVDVNTGQRVDVLLKADQPAGRYWVSVGSQYRKGAPAGYGYLAYKDAGNYAPLKPTSILQPAALADRKWNNTQLTSFKPHPVLLNPASDPAKAAQYIAPAAPLPSFKMPNKEPAQRFILQSTQPLVEENGMLRWALDSIASPTAPPCKPILDQVYDSASWAKDNALPSNANALPNSAYFTPLGGDPSTWEGTGGNEKVVDSAGPNRDTVLKIGKPGAATHIITLKPGEMYEIVIQNDRAGLYGGEFTSSSNLTSNRNGREQHSFHLHGHHFWLVGSGLGEWKPEVVSKEYNLKTPILRDTATVLFNGTTEDHAGWVALRFVANNTGVWPLHCHISWHEFMGQGLVIVEDPEGITKLKVPKDMPSCPQKCLYTFANFNPKGAKQIFSNSLLAPDASNLP